MGEYRKKPVVVEAIQLIDLTERTVKNCLEFMGQSVNTDSYKAAGEFENYCWMVLHDGGMDIPTLEGTMTASIGDYIIKGVNGEFYPCKPDIFEKTYEKVEEPTPTDTFESLTRPIMKWLTETYDPHHRVIISSEVAIVTQDIKGFQTEDYIVD